jgi:hypothetical protein
MIGRWRNGMKNKKLSAALSVGKMFAFLLIVYYIVLEVLFFIVAKWMGEVYTIGKLPLAAASAGGATVIYYMAYLEGCRDMLKDINKETKCKNKST